ncbi:MAG: aminomethyl-transferring glycine dehydrogenase [Caldithrix sp.]|nr:aminomethyl-transferring glycine dehydrogenase [Caldithrix sp.]
MKNIFAERDRFRERHIGVDKDQLKEMLSTVSCNSLHELIDETIPRDIRLQNELNIPPAQSEYAFLKTMREYAQKNIAMKSYIGLGYYNTITPTVIQRNIFENPGWYTQYTPYQAEIAQGRLEALLNFQTMVSDLTGLAVANASLLDEATAAAEAMAMLFRLRSRAMAKRGANTFLVLDNVYPTTIDVIRTRAEPLNIDVRVVTAADITFDEQTFGIFLQTPDDHGNIFSYNSIIERAHERENLVAVAADLLSLTLQKAPGDLGADVVVGNTQRFGVPLGYGGPHAAYFATREEYTRQVPGRIIGASVDRYGNTAYRMALQTREQHIRGERATSNICTAQALLAIMAGMYAVYHGPKGLKQIAERIHQNAVVLHNALQKLGYNQQNENYFDTLHVITDQAKQKKIVGLAAAKGIEMRRFDNGHLGIALDETVTESDLQNLIEVFAEAAGKQFDINDINRTEDILKIPDGLQRKSDFITHPVFHTHQTETKMMRYIKSLEKKDLSLTFSMIPLGSCTMKLNPASAMQPLSWPEFAGLHPYTDHQYAAGYLEMMEDMEKLLCEITGFSALSFQPNSGAQGEFSGLMTIREYFKDQNQSHRNVALIPTSAHGTNPASAHMAGMDVVLVKCDAHGNIDLDDLRNKAEKHKDRLAALMVTYPSTHGVFEEDIKEICNIIHENGGLVYMDGANMNAQVGLTSPAEVGADVCHLNLHKTFGIPHGGGGPGMGPIAVADHLKDYLPKHNIVETGGQKGISAVSQAPFGSPSIIIISYGYIRMLGKNGVTDASRYAILNANYVKERLKDYYPALYKGKKGRVAHELIFDVRPFRKDAQVEVEDIAKRLIDYGFHAPTVSWPVPGTIMFEPTESESKEELDRFVESMMAIYHEIKEIEEGKADKEDNVLKNAPHTVEVAVADNWQHAYTRKQAVYPLDLVKEHKFWSSVGRVDNTYGDRNLVCTCPPVENYSEEADR